MRVVGLDLSVTSTGLVILDSRGGENPSVVVDRLVKPAKSYGSEMPRAMKLADDIETVVVAHSPDLAVIEGYAFGASHGLAVLVELGTLVRRSLITLQVPYIVVPPPTLKKFATGKGNAQKDLMLKEVFRRWAYDTPSNDLADAYWLAIYGLGAFNEVPLLAREKAALPKALD